MTNEEALDYAIHFLKLDYAPSEVVKCLENTKAEIEQLKAEKESIYNLYLEYFNLTKHLKTELGQIMENAYSRCEVKVGLCSECYGYEMCLKALKGKVQE